MKMPIWPSPPPSQTDSDLLRLLKKIQTGEFADVVQEAQGMEPEEVNTLFETLGACVKAHNQSRKLVLQMILMFAVVFLFAELLPLFVGFLGWMYSLNILFSCVFSTSMIFTLLFPMVRSQLNTTKALAQFDDVRAVGPLAEALEYGQKRVRVQAETALIPLLPHLRADDASLLTARQRGCLHRALLGRNTELTLAILKALEQVGDKTALPYVQRLTKAKDSRIRDAANACLPFLNTSAEQARSRETLLRAAQSATETKTLLRPAQNSADANPQQLLRASVLENRPEEKDIFMG